MIFDKFKLELSFNDSQVISDERSHKLHLIHLNEHFKASTPQFSSLLNPLPTVLINEAIIFDLELPIWMEMHLGDDDQSLTDCPANPLLAQFDNVEVQNVVFGSLIKCDNTFKSDRAKLYLNSTTISFHHCFFDFVVVVKDFNNVAVIVPTLTL
jgi:hypothetical protein